VDLFKEYKQYVCQYGDEDGIVKQRCQKWKEYMKKSIHVNEVPYSIVKILDAISDCVNLSFRDHVKLVYIGRKRALITSEPYQLSGETLRKLEECGEKLGFSVSVNDRFSSHIANTGHCIEIAPLKWLDNQKELEARFNSE